MTIVDISYWQGVIATSTFQAWAGAGVTRVIVKAGGADGKLYKDSRHDANVANARAAGLGIDHYFFNGTVDPTDSADAFAAYAGVQSGDALWFDIENEGAMAHWTPAQTITAVQRLQSHTGLIAGLYMSSSVTAQQDWSALVALGCPLWVAQYGSNNGTPQGAPTISYWSTYRYWQFTSVGREPGFAGNLDISAIGGAVVPIVSSPTGYNASTWTTTQIQSALIALGYDLGASGADGVYGPATTAAVHKFESDHGLSVDVGIAGPEVVARLGALTAPPAPAPAPAPAQLAVDGVLGARTISRWQQVMGTPIDGTISNPSLLIKAVQRVCGVAQDGVLGPITRKAVQAHLAVAQDGDWGTQTISALQRRLNQGQF